MPNEFVPQNISFYILFYLPPLFHDSANENVHTRWEGGMVASFHFMSFSFCTSEILIKHEQIVPQTEY